MSTLQPEKKNRLSKLLGGSRRDRSPNPEASPPTMSSVSADSAYASSDTPNAEASRLQNEIIPAAKDSEIGNIDRDRNLGVRPATGEVFDQDTGEVVTVVTTTTTTTTTTTRKPGRRSPDIVNDVRRDVQEHTTPVKPLPQPEGLAELPPNTAVPQKALPANSSVPQKTLPSTQHDSFVSATSSNRPLHDSPPIPHKSLARKSGEYGTSAQAGPVNENLHDEPPVSPTGTDRHNFSYPSRNKDSFEGSPRPLRTTEQPQRHTGTTLADLRAAAKGLHGIGETLRGTLNSAVDERYPRSNAEKAALARSKNEATLSRGRTEMGGIPHREKYPPPPPIPQTNPSTYSNNQSTYPANNPATQSANNPSTHSTYNPAAHSGNNQPTYSGNNQSTYSTNNPPTPSGNSPSTYAGNNQSTHSTNNPSTFSANNTPTNSANKPATYSASNPSPWSANNPATDSSNNPSTQPFDESGASAQRPVNSRTPTNEQGVPRGWHDDREPPATTEAGIGGAGEQAIAQDPEARKSRSIGKLFKRKPVNEDAPLRQSKSREDKSRERKNKYY